MKCHIRLLLCVTMLCALPLQAELEVRFVDATGLQHNPNNQYFIHLLQESLEVTREQFGDYQLLPVDVVISQQRQIKELEKGTFDVFWTMTTPGREQDALPVKVPLSKGSYGIRVLVVNKTELATMQKLNNFKALEGFVALTGEDWPDTATLRFNRIAVKTVVNDATLYPLLRRSKGHYFPRGLFEADAELSSMVANDLAILPQLILRYPAEMQFFVAKHNAALAERLTTGLLMLQKSGRFDQLFYQFPQHAEALQRLNLKRAKVLDLKSPFMVSEQDRELIKAEQDELLSKLGVQQ